MTAVPTPVVDEAVARKVLETVDAGLSSGKGTPVPGHMCVEAAVCYAMGLPHSDNPPCVHPAVRKFKIGINDAPWSSPAARAKGMRRVAIAQLGSENIDGAAFVAYVAEQTIKWVLPIALRAAAALNPEHEGALVEAAVRCEREGSKGAANAAAARAAPANSAASTVAATAAACDAARAATAADAASVISLIE